MKIKDILRNGVDILEKNKIEDSGLKAKMILSNLLNKDKEYLMIHEDEDVNEGINKVFLEKIERLKNNEPIQYILNKQEFMGIELYVDENVLIPQPDTENLVEEIISIANNIRKDKKKNLRILDLCTGSGAIAISLAKLLDNALVYASDISEDALKIAEENASTNMVNVFFFKSDLFKNISELYKFDIIVSNPPYIETDIIDTLSEEVKKEPRIALDGGKDGLEFYKKIIENSKKYLNNEGYIAFEIGYNQRLSVEELLKNKEYQNIYSRKDLSGNDRIVIAQK